MLISKGCNVDIQSKDGKTALIWAASNDHMEVCEMLISKGCNIDIQDTLYGNTALIWAAKNGNIITSIMLIEAGCDYSLKNKNGKSAMDELKERNPGQVRELQVIPLLLFTAY